MKISEALLIETVSRAAPWLATFPTAYAIATAVNTRLAWPVGVAAVVGVAVETLGVASAATALELWSYERSKRKVDPSAPIRLGAGLVALYFAGVITLTVVLEGNLLLAVFPILSLVGVGNLALRADHAARIQGVQEETERVRVKRAAAKAERAAAQTSVQPTPQPDEIVPQPEPARTYAEFLIRNRARNGRGPYTPAQVMSEFGVSRTTAYQWVRRAAQEVQEEVHHATN